jgi:hypothetical protein
MSLIDKRYHLSLLMACVPMLPVRLISNADMQTVFDLYIMPYRECPSPSRQPEFSEAASSVRRLTANHLFANLFNNYASVAGTEPDTLWCPLRHDWCADEVPIGRTMKVGCWNDGRMLWVQSTHSRYGHVEWIYHAERIYQDVSSYSSDDISLFMIVIHQ